MAPVLLCIVLAPTWTAHIISIAFVVSSVSSVKRAVAVCAFLARVPSALVWAVLLAISPNVQDLAR